jgi:hypothetical protein
MKSASRIVHAGTAGIADTSFFRDARLAAERLQAPPGVVTAIEFRRAVADWDIESAQSAAEALAADSAIVRLISAAEVLDGVVTLSLRDGDSATARHWFDALAVQANRPADALWMVVLSRHLENAPTPN